MRLIPVVVAAALAASGCSFDNLDNPYRGLDPAPPAESILRDLNLASLGLKAQPCIPFDAPVARCYEPDRWMGVREGRETLGHIHRQLAAAGARYWGSSASPTVAGAPTVAGLDIGCYFDYETGDFPLRVVIVGPSGEREPCVNGLPGDGLSQVWIIGGGFDPEGIYGGVVMPGSFELLLQILPRRLVRPEDIYGGEAATVDGYYGPELPRLRDSYGVHILPQTVSVEGGMARGLVQYGGSQPIEVPPEESGTGDDGAQPTLIQRETTGAVDVVIEVGMERYSVPIVIRLGESAPFEIRVPLGFDADDLRVAPGWNHTEVPWRGGQRYSGPQSVPDCGKGLALDGGDFAGLRDVPRQECLVFEAQATTPAGEGIVVEAVVATFGEDGTVTSVTDPFVIAEGIEPAIGQTRIVFPDIRLAWMAPVGSTGSTGVWVRYAERSEMRGQ